MSRFRILSLDGGGSWAILEVMALMAIYGNDTLGHEVLKEFDLVAANSGGSIVLGGLVENLTLQKIYDFFNSHDERTSIFVRNHPHLPIYPVEKYNTEAKLAGLLAAFPHTGDTHLAGITNGLIGPSGQPVHLVITTFDYDRNRGVYFRSAPAPADPTARTGWGVGAAQPVKLAEAIHASSNAPILYFDKPAVLPSMKNKRYWDGGLAAANNPSLIAASEAVVLGADPRKLAILSIGTGSTFLPIAQDTAQGPPLYQRPIPSSLIHDIQKASGAVLDDPPDTATFMAHVFAGGPPSPPIPPADSSIVRMSPMIGPIVDAAHQFGIPPGLTADDFDKLVNLGLDAVEDADVAKIVAFGNLWMTGKVPNQPVRMDDNFLPEIGHGSFDAAKNAWLALRAD